MDAFLATAQRRRTTRHSGGGVGAVGANQQPWTFVVVVTNPEVKRQIREAAEKEE